MGLEIGQKVLYPHQIGSNYGAAIYMSIETIKDVVKNYKDEIVICIKWNRLRKEQKMKTR